MRGNGQHVGAEQVSGRIGEARHAEAGVDELVVADFNLDRSSREDVLGRLQTEVLADFADS